MGLDDALIFTRVVECHSFTQAATSLGMQKSTVSRRIALLEERLGYLRELEERRLAVIASVEEQGKMTPALLLEFQDAETKGRPITSAAGRSCSTSPRPSRR